MSAAGEAQERQWRDLPIVLTALLTGQSHELMLKPEVVPLIFVPGIMGTRLQRGGDPVWDPDDSLFMLWNYALFTRSTADTKAKIVGEVYDESSLTPLQKGKKHQNEYEGFEHAQDRGWFALAKGFYATILKRLSTWNQEQGVPGFDLPVYAFGYNWTASNRTSGQRLKEFIDKVIQEQQGLGNHCEQVILISHSMGGLVSRSACMLHGAEGKVRAILHGVQPAAGAPSAFWQMKGGAIRSSLKHPLEYLGSVVMSWVIGSDGPAVTALLGNIPGGLELLPNQHYRTNNGRADWLQFLAEDGHELVSLALPRAGDPYQEIYAQRGTFWALIEPAFLIPEVDPPDPSKTEDAWSHYSGRLAQVKKFHLDLGDYCHPKTQAFYGTGCLPGTQAMPSTFRHPTVDRVQYTLNVVDWKDRLAEGAEVVGRGALALTLQVAVLALAASLPPLWFLGAAAGAFALGSGILKGASEEGKNTAGFCQQIALPDGTKLEVTLEGPTGSGDGTVPDSSATSLRASLGTFAFLSLEHSDAYKVKEDVNESEAGEGAQCAMDKPPEDVAALVSTFLRAQAPS